jgi:hypothetical protein
MDTGGSTVFADSSSAKVLWRGILALLALALTLALAASAGAAWSPPSYLTPQFIPATLPAEVEMDADGDSYFTYALGTGQVQAKKYSAARTPVWTKNLIPPPTNPEQEPGEAEMSSVGVNSAGDSAYAWLTSNNAGTRSIVQARTLSRTGVLGPVRTLADIGQSQGEHEQPAVAVDDNGNAVIAYSREALTVEQGEVQARTLSTTGVLGPAQLISSSETNALAEFVQLGIRPNGDAVFVWQYSRGVNVEGLIQSRTRRAATGTLTPIRNISPIEATFPEFAMSDDGDAIVAWLYPDPFAGGMTVQVRRMPATGPLGGTKTMSPRGGLAMEADVALNDAGAAAAIWSLKDPVTGASTMRGRTLSATDQLGKSLGLSASAPEAPSDPEVGISSAGRIVFGWLFNAPTADRVQSRTLTPTGTLTPVKNVGSALKIGSGGPGVSLGPAFAVAPSGQAAATWPDQEVSRLGLAFGP